MSERTTSGIEGLDELLDGGFPKGRVILVTGEPGSGKTIFASQFLMNGISHYGENGVLVCMDEAKPHLHREMGCFGWDLTQAERDERLAFIDATPLRLIPGRVKVGDMAIDRKDFTMTSLIQAVNGAVQRVNAARVAVDSITSLVLQYEDPVQKRIAVLDLVGALAATGATCLMTSELKSPGLRRTLGVEEFVSHGVIVLQTLRVGPSMTRVIQIQKMRETKCDNQPRPYRITPQGIEVYPGETVFR